jgi:hypothetical protein
MIILTCRAIQRILDDRTILEEIKEDGQQIVFPANLIGTIESEDIESLMEIKDIKLEEGKKKTLLGFLDDEELEVAKLLESYKNERHKVVYTAEEFRIKALIRIRKVAGQELSNKEEKYQTPQIHLEEDDLQLFKKGVDIHIDEEIKENSLVIINGYYAARYREGKLLRLSKQPSAGCTLDDPFVKYYNEGLKITAKEAPLLIVIGDAGTGKTYMAINAALDCIESGEYEQIIITAPTITTGGEDLGYLPGEIYGKMIPYLGGFEDSIFKRLVNFEMKKNKSDRNISELRAEAKKKLDEMLLSETIKILPLGFLAGHSLDKCYVLADEMQNANWKQLKSLITRIGEGTKLIIIGDTKQSQIGANVNVLDKLTKRWSKEPLCWKIDLSESRIRRSMIAGIAVRIM